MEAVTGWGVFALPLSSAHVLALRVFPEGTFTPYVAVWHRDPEGRWSIYVDGDDLGREGAEVVDAERRAGRDDGGGRRLDDDGGAGELGAGHEVVAADDLRLPLAAAEDDRPLVHDRLAGGTREALRLGAAEVVEE